MKTCLFYTLIKVSIFVASCSLVLKGLREKLGLDQCHITVRITIDIITIICLKIIYIVINLYPFPKLLPNFLKRSTIRSTAIC